MGLTPCGGIVSFARPKFHWLQGHTLCALFSVLNKFNRVLL